MFIFVWAVMAAAGLYLAYFIWMHSSRMSGRDADALIVLGFKCEGDSLHPLLKDRLDTALYLFDKHSYQTVILSGGAVASVLSEAEIMKRYLVRNGMPEGRIRLETLSRNTVQNMVNCGIMMAEEGLGTCLVVSNSFHIRRMKYITDSLGMKALFYASRRPLFVLYQWGMTWQEIKAFRLTLPWLKKVAQMENRQMMGKR
ncbi:YdcF family protein [Paenibacillus sp. FJAT-26967]|uniref:YdcF family protein n=1 Tax=Paenibacillus sp. FJAT-26967 TaxID=1729690 RepID=UPI000837AF9B|nr:YdcF family protein [Paenibacillus sp. FJAT-26967]